MFKCLIFLKRHHNWLPNWKAMLHRHPFLFIINYPSVIWIHQNPPFSIPLMTCCGSQSNSTEQFLGLHVCIGMIPCITYGNHWYIWMVLSSQLTYHDWSSSQHSPHWDIFECIQEHDSRYLLRIHYHYVSWWWSVCSTSAAIMCHNDNVQ